MRRSNPCTSSAVKALSRDRKSTRLNSSHSQISYAVFRLTEKIRARSARTHPGSLDLLHRLLHTPDQLLLREQLLIGLGCGMMEVRTLSRMPHASAFSAAH